MRATILMILLCVMALSANAWAAPGDVIVANEVLLRMRVPSGGMSPAERADIVTARLVPMLGRTWDTITATAGGAVRVDGQLLVTATQADAEANGTTVLALASLWAKRASVLLSAGSAVQPGTQGRG